MRHKSTKICELGTGDILTEVVGQGERRVWPGGDKDYYPHKISKDLGACMEARLHMSTEQPIHLTPLPFGAAHVSLLPEVMILARCLAIVRLFLINSHHPSNHILG